MKKIVAKDDCFWTNGEQISTDNIVFLGVNDKAENWREITAEEKAELEEKQNELFGLSL
jgi:hypothetical protein